MDNFTILSESFIFVDSEGKKSLKPDSLEEISEIGYFVQVRYGLNSYAATCPVVMQVYFDSEGAARHRAREICIKALRKELPRKRIDGQRS